MNLVVESTAYIKGNVVRLHVGGHIPIEHQYVCLRMPDGQVIETNVRNLAEYQLTTPATDTNAELQAARELAATATTALDQSRAEVSQLRAEINATRELLLIAEAKIAATSVQAAEPRKKGTR